VQKKEKIPTAKINKI